MDDTYLPPAKKMGSSLYRAPYPVPCHFEEGAWQLRSLVASRFRVWSLEVGYIFGGSLCNSSQRSANPYTWAQYSSMLLLTFASNMLDVSFGKLRLEPPSYSYMSRFHAG